MRVNRLRTIGVAILITAGTAGIAPLTVVPSAAAATQPPFDCTAPIEFVSQGTGPTALSEATYGAGSVTYAPLGSPAAQGYNALAYDPVTKFLYAVGESTSAGELLRIGSDGTVSDLGPIMVAGQSALDEAQDNGAFDAAGNFFTYQAHEAAMYETAIGTQVATAITLSQPIPVSDWAMVGSDLWAMDGTGTTDQLYRVDPTSGQVTVFAENLGLPATDDYGGAWTNGAGNLVVADDDTGQVDTLRIVGGGSAAPAVHLISTYAGPTLSKLDAAACDSGNGDLRVTSSAPATANPGSTVAETFTVTDSGPSASGYELDVAAPPPLVVTDSTASLATPGCAVTAGVVRCTEGETAAGTARSVTMHVTLPHTGKPGTCYSTGAGFLTPNDADSTVSNNVSVPKTCLPKRPEHPREVLSSPHHGKLHIRVTTSPKVPHARVTFYAVRHGRLHRLGSATTSRGGGASKTFTQPAGATVTVESTVAATSEIAGGATTRHTIKIRR